MKKYENTTYAVLLILIFAVSIVMAFAPTASAQAGISQPRTTYGYISVAPLLVGVGQTATVNLWVLPLPEDYAEASWYNPLTHGGSFSGISVTFTKPDGTTDTFTPTDGTGTYPAGVCDALGTMYFYYTPDEAGNWSVTFTMPAQNFTDTTGTVQWSGCTSDTAHFTVQTAAVNAGLLNGYPYSPLPNSNVFWSYPISSNNREWSAIAGDWLQASPLLGCRIVNTGGAWQMYGSGPSTGHILWDVPNTPGGIIGGISGSISYQPPYLTFPGVVVMDGKVFIESPEFTSFQCIDLTTGQVLWTAPLPYFPEITMTGIDLPGNAYIQSSLNVGTVLASSYGATPIPYIWVNLGTVWNYYNIVNGGLAISISNVTATGFEFVDDSPLVFGYTDYGLNPMTEEYAVNYVWAWNLTKVVNGDWWTGIVWATNTNSPGHPGPEDLGRNAMAVSADLSTIVLGGGSGSNVAEGFSTATGRSVWNDTFDYTSTEAVTQLYGVNDFIRADLATSTYYVYSDLTGALLWSTPSVGIYPWNTKNTGGYGTLVNDNNNMYIANPDGTIIALSLATGKVVWESKPIPTTEYSTNVIPYWFYGLMEEGGNLYDYAGYSIVYEINPIPRFAMMVCINATTGATEFTLNGGICPAAAADGYVVGLSEYDGNYYCVGKGQTSTSVSAPTTAQPLGTSILLQGTVLDESPAQPGTPAVSDSSMSEWMDYLHMQNATLLNSPPTPQGVQVTLTALDPNNNTENIGTYTTNGKGNFAVLWTPPVPGKYTITATFAGTDSYWPSSSQTFIAVGPAAAPTTTTTTVVSSGVSSTTLYEAVAAVIVVIIIVGVVIVLALRRRP